MRNSDTKFILDIGNKKIKLLAGKLEEDGSNLRILGYLEKETKGMHRNIIENSNDLSQVISDLVKEMSEELGQSIVKVNIGYNGKNIFSKTKNIMLDLGTEIKITEAEVNYLYETAEKNLCAEDEIVLEREMYNTKINNGGLVKSLVGMVGRYLQGDVHLVTIKKQDLDEIMEVVNKAGLEVDSVTLSAYAAAKSTLSQEEKIKGVALIDIGFGTANLVIYKNNRLIYTKSLPLGSRHYVSDLMYLYELTEEEATKILEKHALVEDGKYIFENRLLDAQEVAEAIDARSGDFINFISQAIYESGFQGLLDAGICLTGGAIKMDEMYNWIHENMEIPVQKLYPMSFDGMNEESPEKAVCIGILMEILEREYMEELKQKTEVEEDKPKAAEKRFNIPDEEKKAKDEKANGKVMFNKLKKMFDNFI